LAPSLLASLHRLFFLRGVLLLQNGGACCDMTVRDLPVVAAGFESKKVEVRR
jgi:hypothetical protein